MKTIKVITFPDGNVAYSSGPIEVSVNKQEPAEIREIEIGDKMAQDFLDNPNKFKVDPIKKKITKLKDK